MPDTEFIVALARLVIAAAWADSELSNDEINALKDLLFNLDQVTGEQWAELELYMDSAASAEQTQQLLQDVLSRVKSEQDKHFVLDTLEKLVAADGVVTAQEQELLEKVKDAVSTVDTGLLAKLSGLLRRTVTTRADTCRAATQRQAELDDFIKNTIYHELKSRIQKGQAGIDLSDEELRKLCLAAGLLSRIAAVDKEISDSEKQAISRVLIERWHLSAPQAELIAEISCHRTLKGLDYFRLARGFFECTTFDERRDFLKCLFQIANACGKTSYDEIEQIRKIAGSLKLSHRDFIDAKLTIPDEDRGGF